MEIGGYDLIFHTKEPKVLAKKIMDFINWPDSVIEKDEEDDFFWYKNAASKKEWDEGIDLPENTMVYFIFDESQLTIVVDKEMADSLKEIMLHFEEKTGNMLDVFEPATFKD